MGDVRAALDIGLALPRARLARGGSFPPVPPVHAPPAPATLPAFYSRPTAPASGPALPRDIAFLVYHGIAPGALYRAGERAALLDLSARHCLIAAGAIAEDRFVDIAGLHHGVRIADRIRPDSRTTLASALRQGWCRATLEDGETVLAVCTAGPAFATLLGGLSRASRAHVVLIGETGFRNSLLAHFGPAIADAASTSVPDAHSARRRISPGQRLALSIATAMLAPGLVYVPGFTVTVLPMVLGLVFLIAAVIHLAACWEGRQTIPPPVATGDAGLPRYSVLVPLHREGPEVIAPLVAALAGLDYPVEKLQILLVVEADDALTQGSITARTLPPHIAMFVAPAGAPRTKPRALNAAMPFVTGERLVVFDAEDRPDPLQLRKAAALFAQSPPEVICLQARLAIDNSGDGLLPAFFRIEYAALFDVTKSGSARLGHPIPLGGTSNHFRTDALRAIGLWDAWNVTEDADLGLRLARHGYRVADLDSTTDEEAPAALGAWMAQRTRWLKGWMQTVLTHSRDPVQTFRDLGPGNAVAALALSLGVVVGTLFGPIFAVLVGWRIAAGGFLASADRLDTLADAFIIVLGVLGLLSTYVPALLACRRRDMAGQRRFIPFLPLYYLLMAVAGWRALYELAVAPHRWNKTRHGLARTSRRGAPPDVQKQ